MERIIVRIRQLLAFGVPLPEIHDQVVGADCDEGLFFLCYHAALMLG